MQPCMRTRFLNDHCSLQSISFDLRVNISAAKCLPMAYVNHLCHRHAVLSLQAYRRTKAFTSGRLPCKLCQLRSKSRRTVHLQIRASSEPNQPDLIERVFGRLFGNKALEERSPGGMKRMSDEALLEQYPATTTEFAEPLTSDDQTMAAFRPLLAQTRLQKLPLRYSVVCSNSVFTPCCTVARRTCHSCSTHRLAYSATEHGWSNTAFHECVNTFGATVIVAQTAGGALCGGYNPRGWIGDARHRSHMGCI